MSAELIDSVTGLPAVLKSTSGATWFSESPPEVLSGAGIASLAGNLSYGDYGYFVICNSTGSTYTDGIAYVWNGKVFQPSNTGDASAFTAGAVTPSDSTVLNFTSLFVGTAGAVSIDMTEGGTAVVFTGITAGTVLKVCGTRVNATGTSPGTNIVWMRA